MSRLRKSEHREALAVHNAAFEDGVCHAIDELHAMGAAALAERLFGRVFRQGDGAPLPLPPPATEEREPLLP